MTDEQITEVEAAAVAYIAGVDCCPGTARHVADLVVELVSEVRRLRAQFDRLPESTRP